MTEEIIDIMQHIPSEVSKDVQKFVDDVVFKQNEFLFFEKDGKSQKAFCTYCKSDFYIEEAEHNHIKKCPVCGVKLIAKNLKYGRKTLKNEATFYYFSKSKIDKNTIVCEGYYVKREYTDYQNPKTEYSLEAAYIFNKTEGAKMIKRNHGYYFNGWREDWKECKSIYKFTIGWLNKFPVYQSIDSMVNSIKNTDFQFLPYKYFEEDIAEIKVFEEYIKHPWIEYLCKMGFTRIIKDKLNGHSIYRCLNSKGKDVFEILQITKQDLREINKYGPEKINAKSLKIIQKQSKVSPKFKIDIEKVVFLANTNIEVMLELMNYMQPKKIQKYLDKQFNLYEPDSYSGLMIIYKDYLNISKQLGCDMKADSVLYPKNIFKSHDRVTKRLKIKKDATIDKKIKDRNSILEKYYFTYKELLIRPIKNLDEIINEGIKLQHCVANYAEKHADSKTNIFVIRKIDAPDNPYFTLEMKDDEIIQCRGLRNSSYGADIEEFLKKWKARKFKKIKAA